MGIDETAFALLDDFAPLGDERKRGDGHDQAQTTQRLRTTDHSRCQWKPLGLISQKVLRDIEPQAILLAGLAIGWFSADPLPHVRAAVRSSHGPRPRPLALFC